MATDTVEDMEYSGNRRGWVGLMRLRCFREYADAELFDSWMFSEKKSLRRRFEDGYLRVVIQDKSRRGPTPEQEQALRYLTTHEREICDRCLEALKAEQERVRSQGWLEPLEPGGAAPRPSIVFTGVEIAKCHSKGCAYIAIYVDTAWEIEHAVGILVHPGQPPLVGFDVMEKIGPDDSEAFVGPEAKNAIVSVRQQLRTILVILRGIVDKDSARAAASELNRYAKDYKHFQLSLERPGREECFDAVYEDEQFQNHLQDVLREFDRIRRELPRGAKYVASAHSKIQSLV